MANDALLCVHVQRMKKQDTEESVTQCSDGAPPSVGEMEGTTAAKDVIDTGSPKDTEPETSHTDAPQQGDGAESKGKAGFRLNHDEMVYLFTTLVQLHTC